MFCFNLFAILFSVGLAFAQSEEKAGEKYLILYQGVEHEETLAVLPAGGDFGGDWKGVTKLAVAREYQKLRFTPIKAGIATLSIHDKKGTKIFEYRIEVRDTKLTRIVREIRALLNEIEGISIKIVNERVVVDGKVVHPEDLNRIVAVLKQYGNDAASLVEVSPFAQQKIAEIIEREINNPDVQVRARNGKYILTGEVNSLFEKDNAELIARTYLPPPFFGEAENQDTIKKRKEDPVVNLIATRPPPDPQPKKLIQLVLHYVELNKDYSNSSRFQWTPTVGDTTNVSFTQDSRQPSGVVSSITGTISNLLPKLNWAKAHGHARILKTTSVITKQDVAGVVQQSTTIPYITQNQLGAAVPGTANVSLVSNITPSIENPRSDLISLKMTFNIGSLVSITSLGPVISNNAVTTEVSVRSGESAAVAGLIGNSQTMDYNKIPDGLQNALFSFYSSKAFQKNQSQFVVFVTPIIKSSASSGVDKVKEKFRLNE
jgi:pilus assembly protein CpaC